MTEADRASEKLVVERLRSHFPRTPSWRKKAAATRAPPNTAGSWTRWTAPPISRTLSHVQCHDGAAPRGRGLAGRGLRSRAAGDVHGRTRRGRLPERQADPRFTTARLSDSLASTGFPNRKRSHNINIHFYYQLAMASHGVRRTGSAAHRPGVRGMRAAGPVLGIRPEALGYGGGRAVGTEAGGKRFRHARRRA